MHLFRHTDSRRSKSDMRSINKRSMNEERAGLNSRLLTLALLTWIIFVHLVYYWNFAQDYGGAILKRIGPWLPW